MPIRGPSGIKTVSHAMGRPEAEALRPIYRKGFPGKKSLRAEIAYAPERFDINSSSSASFGDNSFSSLVLKSLNSSSSNSTIMMQPQQHTRPYSSNSSGRKGGGGGAGGQGTLPHTTTKAMPIIASTSNATIATATTAVLPTPENTASVRGNAVSAAAAVAAAGGGVAGGGIAVVGHHTEKSLPKIV